MARRVCVEFVTSQGRSTDRQRFNQFLNVLIGEKTVACAPIDAPDWSVRQVFESREDYCFQIGWFKFRTHDKAQR